MKRTLITIALLIHCLYLFSQSTAIQVKKDSVKVHNAELIVENGTKNVPGVLFNAGNGRTEFRKIQLKNLGDTSLAIVGQDTIKYSGSGGAGGKSVQFKTGVGQGVPVAGDSMYTNSDFINKNIKVWRNGLLQFRDPSDGVLIDSVIGRITFRPALASNDRVYIEAISGVSMVNLSAIPVTTPVVDVQDVTITLPTNSIQLNGNVSANGNTITQYQWVQLSALDGGGPSTATLATPNAVNCTMGSLTNGTYKFRLTISTSTGAQYSDEATVTVMPDNGGLKTMRVYFSATAVKAIPGWMNVYGDVTNTHIVKTDPVTSWIVDNVANGDLYWKPLNGVNTADAAGHSTNNNSGIVPDIALANYWFINDAPYASNDNLWIRGLDPAKTYTVKLVASRLGSTPAPRYAVWRINGGSAIVQNALGNTSLQSVTTNVAPDGTGKIRIAVYRHSDSNTYGIFSYINALIIQEE